MAAVGPASPHRFPPTPGFASPGPEGETTKPEDPLLMREKGDVRAAPGRRLNKSVYDVPAAVGKPSAEATHFVPRATLRGWFHFFPGDRRRNRRTSRVTPNGTKVYGTLHLNAFIKPDVLQRPDSIFMASNMVFYVPDFG